MLTAPSPNSRIPYSGGTIERPALQEKLRGALTHRLAIVSAPPGYGKTTTVAQFAYGTSYPVAWHAVEERERDVPNLQAHAIQAIRHILPSIESAVPEQGHTARELAAHLANFLRTSITTDIIYVLDDVQLLSGAPTAEMWLRTLVELVPPACHLVLISRSLPDLPLVGMIARRELIAVGQEQLRFSLEEINELAVKTQGAPLPPSKAQELLARMEGWPAGTILALQPLPHDVEEAVLRGQHGPEALFNALANSMLQSQAPGLRDFLLASSTLTRITPALCTQALELPDAALWLNEALTQNLFLVRVSNGLVYHRQFRTLLQDTLKEEQAQRFLGLHRKAGEYFEREGQIDDAFEHFVTAGMVEHAAELAEHVALAYFSQGKIETLLSYSRQLEDMDVQTPRLDYTCSMIYTDRYDYENADIALIQAETAFENRNDSHGIAQVQLQRTMIKIQQGEYRSASAQANALAKRPGLAPNLHGRALHLLGVCALRLGEVERAINHLEEAVPYYDEIGDAYATSVVLQDLEVAYLRTGRLEDAGACLQKVVALRRLLGSASGLALALNNLGYHYHQYGNYARALETFQEGMSVVAHTTDRRSESYLAWSMGDLQRDRGSLRAASRLYARALELSGGGEPSLRCAILISMSVMHRWQGKLESSQMLAKEAAQVAKSHSLAVENVVARAAKWAARAADGHDHEALRALRYVVDRLRERRAQIELVHALGLLAYAALQVGDTNAALASLKEAIDTQGQGGSLQPLIAETLHTPALGTFVNRHSAKLGPLVEGVKKLKAVQEREEPDNQSDSRTSYSLRIFTFGPEMMERDGVAVEPSEWRANRARELFLYLLFVGADTREHISLAFWPDSSTSRVRSNFHTTLYRARGALGENAIIYRGDLYMVNPDLDIWCDAHEMETLTRQARLLPSGSAHTEDLWRRAVELYKGEFLESLDSEWVSVRRETFNEMFMEAQLGTGDCARARGDFRKALDIYKGMLELDPFREDVHRAIMRCYAEMGENKAILMHFRKLEEMLEEELGITPSDETTTLLKSLLK